MPIEFTNVSFLLIAMFLIVGLTNVIVEVIKSSISKPHPNVWALIVAVTLSVVAFFAYCSIKKITIVWYMVCGAIVFGCVCSYIAMNNFDKFWKLFQKAEVPLPKPQDDELKTNKEVESTEEENKNHK